MDRPLQQAEITNDINIMGSLSRPFADFFSMSLSHLFATALATNQPQVLDSTSAGTPFFSHPLLFCPPKRLREFCIFRLFCAQPVDGENWSLLQSDALERIADACKEASSVLDIPRDGTIYRFIMSKSAIRVHFQTQLDWLPQTIWNRIICTFVVMGRMQLNELAVTAVRNDFITHLSGRLRQRFHTQVNEDSVLSVQIPGCPDEIVLACIETSFSVYKEKLEKFKIQPPSPAFNMEQVQILTSAWQRHWQDQQDPQRCSVSSLLGDAAADLHEAGTNLEMLIRLALSIRLGGHCDYGNLPVAARLQTVLQLTVSQAYYIMVRVMETLIKLVKRQSPSLTQADAKSTVQLFLNHLCPIEDHWIQIACNGTNTSCRGGGHAMLRNAIAHSQFQWLKLSSVDSANAATSASSSSASPLPHSAARSESSDATGVAQSRWLFVWNIPSPGDMDAAVDFVAATDLDNLHQFTDSLLHVLEYILEHEVDIQLYNEIMHPIPANQWWPVPLLGLRGDQEQRRVAALAAQQARQDQETCAAKLRLQQEQNRQNRRKQRSEQMAQLGGRCGQQQREIADLQAIIDRLNNKLASGEREFYAMSTPTSDSGDDGGADEVFGLAALASLQEV